MTKIAVVGATGLVGQVFLREIERFKLPYDELVLLASKSSQGKEIKVGNKKYTVQTLTKDAFGGVDIAFFCAGSQVSKDYVNYALDSGARVIDNSSFFRQHPNVPLVAVDVNFDDAKGSRLIANPNCSTLAMIPLLNALKPLGLQSVECVSFQSVSGCGRRGLMALGDVNLSNQIFFGDITKNCIPRIGDFCDDDYTEEEVKMQKETQKILHLPNLRVGATCVRVPVEFCHGVSLSVDLTKDFNLKDVYELIKKQSGIKLGDKVVLGQDALNKEYSVVGRIRRSNTHKKGINCFVVADNLYKGASSNAVLIAKRLLNE